MKTRIREILRECIGWSRYLRHSRELRRSLTVFIYHDVSPNPSVFSRNCNLNVEPDLFDFQLSFIGKHFRVISADELLAGQIPEKAAMITFDDGLAGYFRHALPLLTGHGLPSVSFMNMATVKGEVLWAGVLTYLAEQPEFVEFFEKKRARPMYGRPIHSFLDKPLVREYLQKTGLDPEREIREFVGEIATEEEMREADRNPLVCYGNHLDNHYVSLLLSDEELLASFQANQDALASYSSGRNIFSFPFGQPGIHFEQRQVQLLLNNGAQKVFHSSGRVNDDPLQPGLDRVPVFATERSAGKMWFRIFRMRDR